MISFFRKKQPATRSCVWRGQLREYRRLGEGAYGEILLVRDSNLQHFAAKIAPMDSTAAELLHNEYKVYKHLGCVGKKTKGLPQIYALGFDPNHDNNVLVMNKLGASLRDVMKMNDGSLPTYSVLRIGCQIIRRLEYIHGYGVLHGDIKPRNVLCGTESFDRIYMVDFGLATFFREGKASRHRTMTTGHSFQGTEDFASRHTHRGCALSRRDDLESLGFTLIYLMKGLLPWSQNREEGDFEYEDEDILQPPKPTDHLDILAQKENIPIEELCEGLPQSVESCMRYVYNMDFYDEPDYPFLIEIFENGMKELKEEGDADNGEELDIWPDPHDKELHMGHREEDELWERYEQSLAKKKNAGTGNAQETHLESEAVIEEKEEETQADMDMTGCITTQLVGAIKSWNPFVSSRYVGESSVASEAQKSPLIGRGRDRESFFGKLQRTFRRDVCDYRTIYVKHEEDSMMELSDDYLGQDVVAY